ncbi:MAG TPA: hypothetical protein VMR25_05930 [Planctomycetaceae bacterium]|jgi:hypothetical protein|nr:hypothetical protein [Planctomycetaceae bacterium]
MTGRIAIIILTTAACLSIGTFIKADTVQLINGDRLHGKVASLDEKQLVFRSASFGELKIERTKIDLIALGDKGLPDARQTAGPRQAAAGTGTGQVLGQVAPLLQSPAVQQQVGPMIEQLLGAGGIGEMQKNVNDARRGLQDLKKDFGDGPDSKALDAYINMFNLFSRLSTPSAAPTHQNPPASPHPAPQSVKPPESRMKP